MLVSWDKRSRNLSWSFNRVIPPAPSIYSMELTLGRPMLWFFIYRSELEGGIFFMKMQWHENNNAPSERFSPLCGTVVSHCPLLLYNHMYLFPVQFEFLQMMAPKKCSWVISQKMGYLIYSSHKAYIKQTRFHLSSISIRIVKQLTFFAKKTTLPKRFKVSKK